mmetsp:Transcript_3775/g.6620  ORF Transcript_3775/g.6620 Transcript_3775/m.6620 type:complete len:311 (+) Transcript_3775:669-1601(+)
MDHRQLPPRHPRAGLGGLWVGGRLGHRRLFGPGGRLRLRGLLPPGAGHRFRHLQAAVWGLEALEHLRPQPRWLRGGDGAAADAVGPDCPVCGLHPARCGRGRGVARVAAAAGGGGQGPGHFGRAQGRLLRPLPARGPRRAPGGAGAPAGGDGRGPGRQLHGLFRGCAPHAAEEHGRLLLGGEPPGLLLRGHLPADAAPGRHAQRGLRPDRGLHGPVAGGAAAVHRDPGAAGGGGVPPLRPVPGRAHHALQQHHHYMPRGGEVGARGPVLAGVLRAGPAGRRVRVRCGPRAHRGERHQRQSCGLGTRGNDL